MQTTAFVAFLVLSVFATVWVAWPALWPAAAGNDLRRHAHLWQAVAEGIKAGKNVSAAKANCATATCTGADEAVCCKEKPATKPQPPCYCFDLCNHVFASEFWDATRGVTVKDPSSPWLIYFEAVYGGPVPVPFPLHEIDFFYHQSPTWRQRFPQALNPFRACVLEKLGACNASECAKWTDPLAQGNTNRFVKSAQQGRDLTAKVDVEFGLQHRWREKPDTIPALPFSRLLGQSEKQRKQLEGPKKHRGEWIEVIRTNVFDAGRAHVTHIETKTVVRRVCNGHIDAKAVAWPICKEVHI